MKTIGKYLNGKWLGAALSLFLLFGVQLALAAEPINVGFTTDFSGVTANIGIPQSKVVEMVVKEVNAKGGINGRPINLIIQDNGSDPSKAIGNAKMFKDQYKSKIMLGDITSSVAMALKGWAETNKIPIVTSAPQTDKITDLNKKSWIFRTCAPAELNIQAVLARLKQKGYTKIAFEGTTLGWGTDTLATVKALAPKYGLQIVNVTLVEPKTKDLQIQVKQMKDSGAQAILCCEYEAEDVVLARAMKAIGWKPYLIHTSAANMSATLPLADPKLFEGWEAVTMADSSKPLVQKLWKDAAAYAKKEGVTIGQDEKPIRAYEAISVLIEALKVSKNVDDGTANREAFYSINPNYERASGKKGSKGGFTTAQNHLLKIDDINYLVVKDGKLVPTK